MAHQINPLTPLVTEEFKEVNKENYKDYFDMSQEEVSRLRAENREFVSKLEKLNKKLDKRKNELETERTNSVTLRQFIQELNTKVQLLERTAPPPLLSPTIPPVQNPILNTVINEEFIEKLVIEKTGLESQVCEQKHEIELLNSELMSCKKELTQQTESQHQEYALNQEVTQLRTDLALKEQQLEECLSNFVKMEAECKLGKQLFQEALSSLSAEKEQLQQLLDKREIERNARIEELIESKSKQQQTIDNNNKLHLTELQEKDKYINKLAKELETMKQDLGKERVKILKGKELEMSNLKHEFARTETELRSEVEQQKKELEFFHLQYSKNEENANIAKDLTLQKSNLEKIIEELREDNKKLTLELTENPEKLKLIAELDSSNDIIVKLKQSNLANEKQLRIQINEMENENKQLRNKIKTQMEEHNKRITAFRKSQQDTVKSETMIETKDKQISELQIQLLKQLEKEQTYQTQMEKQIRELNDNFEQLKNDNVDLENLVKSDAKNERFLAAVDEKHVLEEQIDVLRGQIESLTESRQENKQKFEDLEGSFENLINQNKDLEIQLGESKSDYQKLQIEGEQSQQLINDLKTELEIAKNQLKCERENSEIGKLLIDKLNSDIAKLAQNGSGQRIADLERQLADTEIARGETELKLGEMAIEIANRDTRIHTLEQDIEILQNKSQVAQNTSTPIITDQCSASPMVARDDHASNTPVLRAPMLKTPSNTPIQSYIHQNQYQPHVQQSIRGSPILQATHFVPQQQGVSFDQLWKCSFCGSIHPTGQDRDIHMLDQFTASPMVARDDNTVKTPLRRPPLMNHQLYSHADFSMATEIANLGTRIHTLEPNIRILHKSKVEHTTSTPFMPTYTSKTKEDKKQAKNLKDQGKQKYPDTSGATPGATPSDLTPQIIPVANKSGKQSFKVPYRSGKNVEVVKLKYLPNPSEYQSKQVICPINKRYELGVLIGIFDVPYEVGFKSAIQKYVGIKLYNPVGNSSGEFLGVCHFDCEPNYGIFVPLGDVLIPIV